MGSFKIQRQLCCLCLQPVYGSRNLSMSAEQRLQKLSNGSHGNNEPCNTQTLASRKVKMKHEEKTGKL